LYSIRHLQEDQFETTTGEVKFVAVFQTNRSANSCLDPTCSHVVKP